jgi:tRNA(Ile)-lysidine synthase
MIDIVEKFLNEYNLKSPDNTFIVGFSGGCDSLCLLDILHWLSGKYGFKIVAAHLNHNWRGEESLQDESNCKNICESLNIEFISETLEDCPKTEISAREARYDFFLKIARKYPNSSIFTAHLRTDNAETIIYRVIKGTGINGLQGIPPKRMLEEIPVYRPLLSVSRSKIEDYCSSKGLIANVDSSNFDISYKRNFIRQKIMPLFDEINFHAEKSIASLAKIAVSQNNIVEEYLRQIRKEIFAEDKILIEKFVNLSTDVQKKLVYDICLAQNLDYDSKKVENILGFIVDNINSKSGSRYSLTNDLWLFVNSKEIYLIDKVRANGNNCEINITKEGEYSIPCTDRAFSFLKYEGDGNVEFPSENAFIAYVNLSDVGLNLAVRTRRDGDFITPFGMSGSMKLKKYLNSKGVSQHEKDELVLLCSGAEVLWVAGVGLSNKLKVVHAPSHVLELKCKK